MKTWFSNKYFIELYADDNHSDVVKLTDSTPSGIRKKIDRFLDYGEFD